MYIVTISYLVSFQNFYCFTYTLWILNYVFPSIYMVKKFYSSLWLPRKLIRLQYKNNYSSWSLKSRGLLPVIVFGDLVMFKVVTSTFSRKQLEGYCVKTWQFTQGMVIFLNWGVIWPDNILRVHLSDLRNIKLP